MTQKSRILTYCQDHPGGISCLEATQMHPPIMCAWKRIAELEKLGYVFDHIEEKTDNARYVRYKLKDSGVKDEHIRKTPSICTNQQRVLTPCSAEAYRMAKGG